MELSVGSLDVSASALSGPQESRCASVEQYQP